MAAARFFVFVLCVLSRLGAMIFAALIGAHHLHIHLLQAAGTHRRARWLRTHGKARHVEGKREQKGKNKPQLGHAPYYSNVG